MLDALQLEPETSTDVMIRTLKSLEGYLDIARTEEGFIARYTVHPRVSSNDWCRAAFLPLWDALNDYSAMRRICVTSPRVTIHKGAMLMERLLATYSLNWDNVYYPYHRSDTVPRAWQAEHPMFGRNSTWDYRTMTKHDFMHYPTSVAEVREAERRWEAHRQKAQAEHFAVLAQQQAAISPEITWQLGGLRH